MNKTDIAWCDTTWNPVTGCAKVSDGCRHCYAERIANRFWGERKFGDVRCHAYRLNQPSKLKKPSRIFVNSMSDLFHPDVPQEFIKDVWTQMMNNPHHTFMILTKRADRMANAVDLILRDGFGVLPNVWLIVSVENQKAADERVPYLLQTSAAVRGVSCEPLLGAVDLGLLGTIPHSNPYRMTYQKLHWVICGGESGPRARPMHPDWARSLRDQCQDANVPFFFKQWGEWWPAEKGRLYDTENTRSVMWTDGQDMLRIGKKAAGRLLDGVEWNEFPEVAK